MSGECPLLIGVVRAVLEASTSESTPSKFPTDPRKATQLRAALPRSGWPSKGAFVVGCTGDTRFRPTSNGLS